MPQPEELVPEVLAVLGLVQSDLDSSLLFPRRQFALDRTLLGLTSKLIRLAESICCLVSNGFYGEAYGLSRSSVDAFLRIKFISNKQPEERAASFLRFVNQHLIRREECRQAFFPEEPAPSEEIQKRIDAAKKEFGNRTNWESSFNMANEAYEDPRDFNDAGEPYKASHDYQGIYERTSHWVHCNVVALLNSHIFYDGAPFSSTKSIGSHELEGVAAMLHGVCYVHCACIITLRLFGLVLDPQTERRLNDIEAKLKDALLERGMISKKM